MAAVPILTYHSNNINGNDYHNNDHVALAADLRLFKEYGIKIISLDQLFDWWQGKTDDSAVENSVVLTCDDGSWFDYFDLEHPVYGLQTSFYNLLFQHQAETQCDVHLSSFVIVSPNARKTLDKLCLVNQGWWDDSWWQEAQNSGLMKIENHSWNHNHLAFHRNYEKDNSFREIDGFESCEEQLRQAQNYLQHKIGINARYFAYPYGNYSQYLVNEYLPQNAGSMGLQAAFSTEPKHVDQNAKQWALPRYVCGEDWHSQDQLKSLLHS